MPFLPGTTGYVAIGATTYAFGKWKLAIRGGTPKVTNWSGGGYQQLVAGVVAGTVTVSGAWNVGGMPVAIGALYTFHLGLGTGIELIVNAIVSAIDPENDVEDTPRVSVTAESSGAFVAVIV